MIGTLKCLINFHVFLINNIIFLKLFNGLIYWKTTQSWLNIASFSLKSGVQRHLSVFITWCLRNHPMRHKNLTTTSHTSAVLTCWEVSYSLDTPSSFGSSCQVTKIVLVRELYILSFKNVHSRTCILFRLEKKPWVRKYELIGHTDFNKAWPLVLQFNLFFMSD